MKQIQIIDRSQDEHFMQLALQQAQQGAALGEVPVGAVLVLQGEVIGGGFNCPISTHDPSAPFVRRPVRLVITGCRAAPCM